MATFNNGESLASVRTKINDAIDKIDGNATISNNISVGGNITVTGTVDGRDVAADGTKLDGIEAGATADQSDAEIKTAYENNANTNAFTDAEQTKLAGIETNADVTDTANVTAAGALMDSELANEDAVKALNQGVATTNSPSFAGISVTGEIKLDGQHPLCTGGSALGVQALGNNTTGTYNTAAGSFALLNNTTGSYNTAAGSFALNDNTTGLSNTAVGGVALVNNTTGSSNTAVGGLALRDNETGTRNVGIGVSSGSLITGSKNTIIGSYNGNQYNLDIRTSDNNIVLSDGDGNPRLHIDGSGDISISGSLDGRDVAADGTKLDSIETGADVTDAANVTAAGALMDNEVTNLDAVKSFDPADYATATQGATADAALPKSGGTLTGDLFGTNATLSGYLRGPSTFHIDPAAHGDDTGTLVVRGNLTVQGTTTSVESENVSIADSIFILNSNATGAATEDAGVEIERGLDTNVRFIWDETNDRWDTGGQNLSSANIIVSGTVDGRDVAADGAKLDGIEANADVTDTANVTAAGALMDSEVTNLAQVKAFDSTDYATAAQGALADSAVQPNDSPSFGNITVTGTVDGRDIASDGTKLDGIEPNATADQTGAEIKAAYEAEANTNAFTDAEKTKLSNIEANATADMTASEILTAIKTVDGEGSGLDADTLDGLQSSSFLRSDAAGTVGGKLTFSDGDNAPEFKEIRYTDASGMKVIQTYMGTSYFTSGEYQKIIRVTPSYQAQNWLIRGRIIVQSASKTQVLNVNSSLRSNTLPDLQWTNTYTEELSTTYSRYIEPYLWTDETNGDFIFVVKVLDKIFGNITVELDIIERNAGYLDDVSVYREPITEQTTVDTGYTERSFNRLTFLTKDRLNVGGNITLSGTVDGVDIAARDAVLTSTTTTANAALPKSGGTMTGALRNDQEDLSAAGGTLAVDLSSANNFKITMSAATTLSFSNVEAGRFGNLIFVQNATGGYSFTLPAICKTPENGASIVQATGANEISILSYYVVDANTILVNYIGDFA